MARLSLNNHTQLVKQLKQEILSARTRAVLTVNLQLLKLYWKLGRAILQQQEKEGWGARVIDRLSEDLRQAFPDMKGLSCRNLKYMRSFAEAYPQFVQGPLAQLPWYHHITLLTKITASEERLFYIQKAIENGWSRNMLVHQIESGLYKRQGQAVTNFEQTLSGHQSDLAREMIKDPYKFDFLTLYDEYKERDLEKALMDNLTRFLLELGAGFSFVSRQYPIEAGDRDYHIDLLFYRYKLHCFVAVELKAGGFQPEYAGKLNFYLNLLDDKVKRPEDNASIGLLICKQHNKVVAEYAIRGINKPIGISAYEISEMLPDILKDALPTIEQIEEKLKDQ